MAQLRHPRWQEEAVIRTHTTVGWEYARVESKPAFVPDRKAQNPISAVRFWLDKYLNFFSLGFNNLKMGIIISHLVEEIK